MTEGTNPNDSDTKILFTSKTAEILEAIRTARLNSSELTQLEGEIMKIRGERNTNKHIKRETKREAV